MSVINIPSTTVTKNAPSVEVVVDLGMGIDIAMSYATALDETHEVPLKDLGMVAAEETKVLHAKDTTGVSTIDKRNRKKRAVKKLSPEQKLSKLSVGANVKEFYSKYLRNIFFKAKDPPVVVDINTFTVTYDKFYNAFKDIGD